MRMARPTLAVAAALLPAQAWCASEEDWDDASRIGEVVLVVTAIGHPALTGDGQGLLQAGGSIGSAWLVTEGLKQAFPERRPDGSDRRSFPSGHTSISFAAAATLHRRNGWEVGLPAMAVATFVGVARVKANEHHWYDVLAGAGIGGVAGYLITSPRADGVRLFPWGDTKSAGIVLTTRF